MIFKITYPNNTEEVLSFPMDENTFPLLDRVKKFVVDNTKVDIVNKADEVIKA